MFVFIKEKVVRRKVTIQVPDDDDRSIAATCYVTWKIVATDNEQSKTTYDKEFFAKIISNIEEIFLAVLGPDNKPVLDEHGQPKLVQVTFTPQFLADFLSVSYVITALTREYLNCTIAAGRGNL